MRISLAHRRRQHLLRVLSAGNTWVNPGVATIFLVKKMGFPTWKSRSHGGIKGMSDLPILPAANICDSKSHWAAGVVEEVGLM